MRSPEVFYLHIDGEQRGPYTIHHVDHLVNSGLIAQETLFWREGLDQWQPVTDLVVRRENKRSWKPWIIAGSIAFVVLLLLWIFGPITVAGWREANQHQFTTEAAYWRARDVVRNHAVPKGALVRFDDFEAAQVTLRDGAGAEVLLRGELISRGGKPRPVAWLVEMSYDAQISEWSGVTVTEKRAP